MTPARRRANFAGALLLIQPITFASQDFNITCGGTPPGRCPVSASGVSTDALFYFLNGIN
jgi:hypothetical protein